jgi:hypothetical protein
MGRFLQRLPGCSRNQRLTLLQVASGLIEAQPSSVSSSTNKKRPSRSTTAATVTFGFQLLMAIPQTKIPFYPLPSDGPQPLGMS